MIPSVLRSEMLCLIHQGHLGIEKCRQRARQVLFWPNMNKDIENMVTSCATCQRHRMSNPREPMISHQIPDRAWQTVGTDLFEWDGSNFFLIVDYYSRFIEIERLRNSQSTTVIKERKQFSPDMAFQKNSSVITVHVMLAMSMQTLQRTGFSNM